MADLTELTTDELVDDYYASKMEAEAFRRLIHESSNDRIKRNREIMEAIRRELEQRGELERINVND